MNESFSSYTPRVIPLNYDALGNRVGTVRVPVSLDTESCTVGIGFTNGVSGTFTDTDGSLTGTPGTVVSGIIFNDPNYAGNYVDTEITLTGISNAGIEDCAISVGLPDNGLGGTYFDIIKNLSPALNSERATLKFSVSSGSYVSAATGYSSLVFSATIDGTDELHVQGNRWWIVHQGVYAQASNVKVTPSGASTQQNGVVLTKITSTNTKQNRGNITIKQQPSPANNYETVILIDDEDATLYPGTAPYAFALSWS